MTLEIRVFKSSDASAVLEILLPTFRAGDTYAIDPDISESDALAYWTGPDRKTFVAELDGQVVGTYYIRPNQAGGGAHVCNFGFMTSPAARGKGVARAMLEHAEATARDQGYQAVQFNFVVATNTRAIQIWESHNYRIVGRLPAAFLHPDLGYVDALVMWKDLI